MNMFANKTVVISGGNSGIGAATALEFAAAGARVIIIGRDAATLQQVAEAGAASAAGSASAAGASIEVGGSVEAIRADLGSMHDVRRAVQEIRGLTATVDVFFACAGTAAVCAFETTSEETWDRIMNVNLKGLFFLTQGLVPLMQTGSSIILCASVSAHRAYPAGSVYCASKAAVRSLTGVLSVELAPRGIRVNTLTPGSIDTPMLRRTEGISAAAAEEFDVAQIKAIPMARQGDPRECAATVLFLASAAATYITGAEIVVDGGMIGPT